MTHHNHTRPPRAALALLLLAGLLAACATQPPPLPDPAEPLPVTVRPLRPTTVEVDPIATPAREPSPAPHAAPTRPPAPSGDCPASFEAMDGVDRALFEGVAGINDVFLNRRFAIWDDKYRFDDIPIVLARRDRAGVPPRYGFLFNWSSGVLEHSGTIELPTYLDLGTVYCLSPIGLSQNLTNAPSLLRQPLHAPIDGLTMTDARGRRVDDTAFLLIYGDRSRSPAAERAADPRASDRWSAYAVRAAFGRWQAIEGAQDEQFKPASLPAAEEAAPPAREQVALALLEQRVLAEALRGAASDEALLRQLVAIRQERAARDPEAIRAEQAREQRDGTAEYAAYRFATAAGQVQLQSWRERLLAAYAGDSPPASSDGIAPIERFMREQRPALTGAAIGLLLDASAVGWRPRMAEGLTPFDVLAATVNVSDAERDALVRQAKQRFGYAELDARAAALVQ